MQHGRGARVTPIWQRRSVLRKPRKNIHLPREGIRLAKEIPIKPLGWLTVLTHRIRSLTALKSRREDSSSTRARTKFLCAPSGAENEVRRLDLRTPRHSFEFRDATSVCFLGFDL